MAFNLYKIPLHQPHPGTSLEIGLIHSEHGEIGLSNKNPGCNKAKMHRKISHNTDHPASNTILRLLNTALTENDNYVRINQHTADDIVRTLICSVNHLILTEMLASTSHLPCTNQPPWPSTHLKIT